MPASRPKPSLTTYAVESGNMLAANREALRRPNAKRTPAYCPANGSNAAETSATLLTWTPFVKIVAAHNTTMKKATTFTMIAPVKASIRESVSYTHLRAHETPEHLVCRLLLEKKKTIIHHKNLNT